MNENFLPARLGFQRA